MKVIFSQEGVKNEILNVLFFNHTGNILSYNAKRTPTSEIVRF